MRELFQHKLLSVVVVLLIVATIPLGYLYVLTAPNLIGGPFRQPKFKAITSTSYMNAGSAKKLVGDCLIVNVFLSDSESTWSLSEIENTISQMNKAKRFLEQQAANYHKKLTIICDEPDLIYKVKSSSVLPNVVSLYPWADEMIHKQMDGDQVMTEVTQKYKTKNIAFFLHVNKSGISYSIPLYKNDKQYIEPAIIFHQYFDGTAPVDSTYPRMILDLFGGMDLTFPVYDKGTYKADIAAKYFPNDIMIRDSNDLNQLNIGEVTAYCIGWKNKNNKKYDAFFN